MRPLPFFCLAALLWGGDWTLMLPHSLRAGETVFLEVKVGPVPRGTQIEISTGDGTLLGNISPYGTPAGHDAGTFTVPVPVGAIVKERISVRFRVSGSGHGQRSAAKDEVKSAVLKIVSPSR
jgi:hypothetical protein